MNFSTFKYKSDNKTIELYRYGCGGYSSGGWTIDPKVELKDAKKDGNKIYIYEGVDQTKYQLGVLKATISKTLKNIYVLENGNYRFESLEVTD